MKRLLTFLSLIIPFMLCAQRNKKEKLTPEQIATRYLYSVQLEQGFDTLYVSTCTLAGKEDGYPALSKEFNINVTHNAGSAANFEKYCKAIQDTLIAISRRYMGLLLDTTSRQFSYDLEKRKYVETKSIFSIEYGHKDNEKRGSYFTDNIYSPGRPW